MKTYWPEIICHDVWGELYFKLRSAQASGIDIGAALDGTEPKRVYTTKEGIEIDGSC